MTRSLARKNYVQFGKNAPLADVDKFGSVAAGALVNSLDPDIVQALSEWTDGWVAAVMGNKSPVLQDLNAFCYITGWMLSTIFEGGVPDWVATATYSTGSLVNDGAGNLYKSRSDANINHAVTNPIYWTALGSGKSLNPQVSATLAARAVATWLAETAANNAININGLCWSPDLALFVAVGNASTNGAAVSADGLTWTAKDNSENNTWAAVCWSPELKLLCAVANNGTHRAQTSPDGTTWTTKTAAEANTWVAVCWAPELGKFFAVSIDGTHRVQSSSDGTTWATATAASASAWRSICYSSELLKLVAVSSGGSAMYSTDGVTWTTSATIPEANQWESVCWSPELGLFVAVADSGTNRVMYSRDGDTWVAALSSEQNAWTGVCWCAEIGLFVAVSNGGTNRVMTSPDAITWTARAASSAKTWNRVAWSPQLGIAAAGSADGGGSTTGMMISKYVQKFIAP